jgi:DNA-directed RNA polymerase alpha subunit
MRITIEATDDIAELMRARDCIDAILAPLAEHGAMTGADARLDALALSPRARNALAAGNVLSIADLCQRTREELLRMQGFGRTSLNEVTAALAARGLRLHCDEPH